jgi:hypothetical protein
MNQSRPSYKDKFEPMEPIIYNPEHMPINNNFLDSTKSHSRKTRSRKSHSGKLILEYSSPRKLTPTKTHSRKPTPGNFKLQSTNCNGHSRVQPWISGGYGLTYWYKAGFQGSWQLSTFLLWGFLSINLGRVPWQKFVYWPGPVRAPRFLVALL